jgi:hypothetical protein
VPITLGASVNIGTPKVIGRYPSASAFAAAADGQRFLTAVPQGGSDTASPITAVLNWAAGLKH